MWQIVPKREKVVKSDMPHKTQKPLKTHQNQAFTEVLVT